MGKQESTTTTTFAKGKTNPLLPEVTLRKKKTNHKKTI